jgi:hypothetical protein
MHARTRRGTGWFPLLALCMAPALGACASSGGTTASNDPVLSYDEMARTSAANLYEAVQRLRPLWLHQRSARSLRLPHEVAVYQGPSYVGPVEVLRQYRLEAVTHLRYLDASTASATLAGYGSRHLQGAIVLQWGGEGSPPRPTDDFGPRPWPPLPP